jgi:hypothetical protein
MKTGDEDEEAIDDPHQRPQQQASHRVSISGSEDGLTTGRSGSNAQRAPSMQNIHWLSRGAMGVSSRRLSLQEALKLEYDPLPPAEEDDDRWIEATRVPKVRFNLSSSCIQRHDEVCCLFNK